MPSTSTHDSDRAFGFLKLNEREVKPRTRGITETLGPYHAPGCC
jgi:hypothetical protein